MKRTFIFLTLLLTTVLTLSAQSLNGTWRTFFDDQSNPHGYFLYYTFSGSSSVTVKMTMRANDESVGVLDISVTWKGTYQRSGNTLDIKLEWDKPQSNVDNAVWSKDMALEFHRNPGMEELTRALISEKMLEGIKDQSDFISHTYSILDLQQEVLMLKQKDEVITFVRMKNR